MLCLTTRWVPWSDENPQDRLRTILDLDIPGIILSSEDPLDQWSMLAREITGSQHSLPAATAPVPEKPFLPRQSRRLPRLDAIEESEAKAARSVTLSALAHCRDLGIPALILTPSLLPQESDRASLLSRQQQWQKEKFRCENAVTPGDVESAAAAEIQISKERSDYQRFLKVWHKQLLPIHSRRDALFKNLDPLLNEADRCQVTLLIRESSDPWNPLARDEMAAVFQTFSGAPMRFLFDPAAESRSRDLLANELEAPSPLPDQDPAGMVLGDFNAGGEETLPGHGLYNPKSLFFSDEAAFSYPLHILDPAPGPNPGDFHETVELCRNLGIDGAPPPEPGEPWIIF